MPAPPMSATDVLDREFLEIRAKILEIAASLDRLDRADGSVAADARYDLIRRGIDILNQEEEGRAERLQLLFSREYDQRWRGTLGVK